MEAPLVVEFANDLNRANASTVREASRQASSTALSSEPVAERGRAEARASHGEPVEAMERLERAAGLAESVDKTI